MRESESVNGVEEYHSLGDFRSHRDVRVGVLMGLKNSKSLLMREIEARHTHLNPTHLLNPHCRARHTTILTSQARSLQ
jgi:hypothetical protein